MDLAQFLLSLPAVSEQQGSPPDCAQPVPLDQAFSATSPDKRDQPADQRPAKEKVDQHDAPGSATLHVAQSDDDHWQEIDQ